MKHLLFLFSFIFVCSTSLYAKSGNIFLSPKGSDANNGTLQHPVASVDRAMKLASVYMQKEPVNIVFLDGIYYLNHPINISSSL